MNCRRASIMTVALMGVAACATMGSPRTFRFTSNRKTTDARTCAVLVLRRHGFTVVPDTTRADTTTAADSTTPADSTAATDTTAATDSTARADSTARTGSAARAETTGQVRSPARARTPTQADTTVLVRRPHRTSDGPGEWWRARLWLEQDRQGRTVVVSVLGASSRQAGPYGAPSEALEDVGSDVTARCMW